MPSSANPVVKEGASVRLLDLKQAEWNGKCGVVCNGLEEGRFSVRLNDRPTDSKPVALRPRNLVVVCSGCGGDAKPSGTLKTCSRCRAAAYCSSDCQKSHWAEHKLPCKKLSAKLQAVEENAASGFRDHPSWKVHLTAHQRRFLREHHAHTACATAWPVCGLETDAMLTGVMMPSFLVAHPNQRFKVVFEELPSFRMAYPEGPGCPAHGRVHPAGRRIALLSEYFYPFGRPPPVEEAARCEAW